MAEQKRGTFIHGIAASEHLDSSGERIQIEGVDISSLTKDGTFNYEHDSKSPSSIVGKIWEAKKILKRADCENDHQREFWDKLKMPFIYVAGELFDAVGHQAAGEVAAMLRYDQLESLNKDAKKLINFSIEGSRVEKQGSIITKCIARKVSITLTPCNKVCEAHELKIDEGAKKETADGKFSFVQDVMSKADEPSCQIMKGEIPFLYKADLKSPPGTPATPKRTFTPQNAPSTMRVGDRIDYTKQPRAKTGQEIYGKMPKQKPSWQKDEKEVKMPAKEAVKEHKRLIGVLESPSHKDDKEEAKKQKKELKEYKKIAQKSEDKTDGGKLEKPYQSEAQRRWAHTEAGKEALGGAAAVKEWDAASKGKKLPEKKKSMDKKENPCWDGYKKVPGKKDYSPGSCVKKTLDKYASNVRKAITASCGMGSPSTKVQDLGKSEFILIRKLGDSDINKASFNVRQQRKKVFGTNSQPAAKSAMREKHIAHIKKFVDKFLGLDLQPSGGKINDKTGERRDANSEQGVDKPDWRSGKFEAQWNPEAIVHEIAHLMLMPEGVGLEDGQRLMDKQYSDVQKQYGYMQQKRSQGEVQPMAAEQLIRRFLGMPASQVSVPVKDKNAPPRTSVEDPSKVIATRVKVPGKKEKYVDLIRQARNLSPEHKQRLHDIFSGNLKFHPDKGWSKAERSLDAAITNRQPGAVVARQAQRQQSQELPPNVVRMKQPAQPAPAPQAPAQPAAQPAMQQPKMKIAKSEFLYKNENKK